MGTVFYGAAFVVDRITGFAHSGRKRCERFIIKRAVNEGISCAFNRSYGWGNRPNCNPRFGNLQSIKLKAYCAAHHSDIHLCARNKPQIGICTACGLRW